MYGILDIIVVILRADIKCNYFNLTSVRSENLLLVHLS